MAAVTSILFPISFDVLKLQADLKKILDSGWSSHYNSMAFSGDWSSIALVSEGGLSSNILATPSGKEVITETDAMKGCDYFREVINYFECPKTTARLLRLGAGAEIKPHTDNCLGYSDGVFRIHIPVTTNPDVEFILAGNRVIMNEGTCWYIDANEEHSVANRGSEDRVHLVIDCERNEWTDNFFFPQADAASLLQKKEIVLSPEDKQRIIEELEKLGTPGAKELAESLKR